MRFAGLLIAAAAAVSAPAAHAEILFANNFDAEHGGVPVANYTGFDGLTVVGGPINLVGPWAPVLRCVGDKGQCIELYGTPKLPASFQSTTSYSFAAGDTVTLSFDVSGNQIGLNSQTLFDGFNFTSGPTKITRSTVNGLEQGPGTVTQIALSQSVWSRNPFSTKSISFTAAQEGAISFFIGGYYFGTVRAGPGRRGARARHLGDDADRTRCSRGIAASPQGEDDGVLRLTLDWLAVSTFRPLPVFANRRRPGMNWHR